MSKKEKKELSPTVLIPLLSKQEENPGFLNSATQGFDYVTLLAVIDQTEMVGRFGFMANEIRSASQLLEKIKSFLEAQGKIAEDVLEWGETGQKIEHVAMLNNCAKIVLVQQENQYFKKLLKRLEESGKCPVETVAVAQPETKKQ
jgi:hypothetical protein